MAISDTEQPQIKILLIHKQAEKAEVLHKRLIALEANPSVCTASQLSAAIKEISNALFNLILVDLDSSDNPINQTIDALLGQAPGVPIVLTCIKSQEAEAKELLTRGVLDYLVENRDWNHATLTRVLRFAINQQLNEEEISKLTQYDLLTGVANRYLYRDRLSQATIRAQRSGKTIAVVIIDVNQFHAFNEQEGYQLGDKLLKNVSKQIVKSVRRQDTVARLGGDEFAIVLEGLNDPQDAGLIAKEILDQFKKPIIVEESSYHLTLSIGIAVSSERILDPDTLTKQADIARYRAKEEDGNHFEFYNTKDNTEYQDRHMMAEELNSELSRIFNGN